MQCEKAITFFVNEASLLQMSIKFNTFSQPLQKVLMAF